jgi:hypothetical protein
MHATPRPLQTRFRFASACQPLKLATCIHSQAHSPKGTPSGLPPSTGCRRTVSDSFHSPRRGSFHLSLTVLVRYRSSRVFSLGVWTPLLPTMLACIVVLRILPRCFTTPTGLSPLSLAFPEPFGFAPQSLAQSFNPDVTGTPVWAPPRSLATTSGIVSFPHPT